MNSNEFGSPLSPKWDQISRRSMLRGSAAMLGLGALSGVTGFGVVTAHGQDQQVPQKGGILVMSLLADPPTFDPLSSQSGYVLNTIAPCYNSIVRYDPANPDNIIGDLATDWTVSEDGLTYTFALHQNVSWHDGQPFSSEDVKYTFDTLRSPPDGVVSVRQSYLNAVASIETPDANTVVFVLSRPQRAFLQLLAVGWMLVLPKHVLQQPNGLRETIVGTGPFKFKARQPGVSIELERNESYHIPDRPFLDGIQLFVIEDREAALSYLRTGRILFLDSMTAEEAERVNRDFPDRATAISKPSFTFSALDINTANAPFDDIRVRKAMSLALDRNAAVQILRKGSARPGGIMPPGRWELPAEELLAVPGYADDVAANREEAKRLLAEAEFPADYTVNIVTSTNSNYNALAVLMQDQLRQIGVNATIGSMEFASFYSAVDSGQYDIAVRSESVFVNDPDALFPDKYSCDSPTVLGACSVSATEAYKAQMAMEDGPDRLAKINEMDVATLNEFSTLIVLWRDRALAHSTRLHGYEMPAEPENNRRMEDVWLSA